MHSTPQCLPNVCLTQPLPALSDSQVVRVVYSMYTTDRAGRGCVRHMFGRRSGMLCVISLIYIYSLAGAVPSITNIYSLVVPNPKPK